jgi:hypothetical protein
MVNPTITYLIRFSNMSPKSHAHRLAYQKEYRTMQRENYLRSRDKYRMKMKEVYNRLKCGPCMDCKVQYNPWQMQFDHRNPELKSFQVSKNASSITEKVLSEIKKCDLVCANCHADRTHKRRLLCKATNQ